MEENVLQKRMMVLVNPNAGKGGYKSVLGEALQVFCRDGWLPTVYFTQAAGDAPGMVEQYAPDYDLVVCLGGDGTLSETCCGMMRLGERKRPVGYIPLGTANDVARTLKLSHKGAEAAEQIVRGKPLPYDIGKFGENDYFTYVAAFGAFTEVSYGTPQEQKQALGQMAYMLEGIRQLPKITSYHALVEFDGGAVEDDFLFGAVTNTTSVAGLVRLGADDICLSDGMSEVLLVRKPKDILDMSEIISSVLSSDFSGESILFLKSSRVHVTFDRPVAWTRDGEDGGEHREVIITNCHPGVDILV